MDPILHRELRGGEAGRLDVPIDEFRAASNASATALSAHTVLTSAGVTLVSVGLSNVVKLRMENAQFRNQESWRVTVEVRDGTPTGNRLLGPFDILPGAERNFNNQDLLGRAAYSSIMMWVVSGTLSGGTGPPISAGVIGNVGFVAEPYLP